MQAERLETAGSPKRPLSQGRRPDGIGAWNISSEDEDADDALRRSSEQVAPGRRSPAKMIKADEVLSS